MSSLLGLREVADLLGLTREGIRLRRQSGDFAEPVAELACGPVWTRDALIEYACSRSALREERAAIARLAEEASTPIVVAGLPARVSADTVATIAGRGRLRSRR
jgi:hypothetical protein